MGGGGFFQSFPCLIRLASPGPPHRVLSKYRAHHRGGGRGGRGQRSWFQLGSGVGCWGDFPLRLGVCKSVSHSALKADMKHSHKNHTALPSISMVTGYIGWTTRSKQHGLLLIVSSTTQFSTRLSWVSFDWPDFLRLGFWLDDVNDAWVAMHIQSRYCWVRWKRGKETEILGAMNPSQCYCEKRTPSQIIFKSNNQDFNIYKNLMWIINHANAVESVQIWHITTK